MVDFEDEEFAEPSAMVQINTPNPNELKAYPEQRTILRMRFFRIPSLIPDFHCLNIDCKV